MAENMRETYFDVLLTKHKAVRVKALSVVGALMMAEAQLNKDTTEYWEATDAVPSEDQEDEDDSDIYTIKDERVSQ